MFSFSFSKKNIVLSTVVVLSLGLTGCGGSGGSSSAASSTAQTGIFADAPVQGLSYKTTTQSGFTDAQGHFKYKNGETVEFKLGTLSLGKGKAGAFITPYDISDNNGTATNIALVLQNFDGNRSNTQILDLSKLKDYIFASDDINITATPSALESKLASLLATGSFQGHIDDKKHDLIRETKVKKNMDDYIHAYETEHPKITTPTTSGGGSTTNNIVPYTQTSTQQLPTGDTFITKLGATGKVQAFTQTNGGQKFAQLKLIDSVTSLNIIAATSTVTFKIYDDKAGNGTSTSVADYKAGTEHIIEKTDKYGPADCINTYKPVLPYTMTNSNNIYGLNFGLSTLIKTTCPAWVNDHSSVSVPKTLELTKNYTLTDSSNSITKISIYNKMYPTAPTGSSKITSFTKAYLNGKTFYGVYSGDGRYSTYNFSASNANKTFTDKNADNADYGKTLTGYHTGDGMIRVVNGELWEYTTDNNGNYNNGINKYKIVSSDDKKITTTMTDPAVGTQHIVDFYFNQNNADTAISTYFKGKHLELLHNTADYYDVNVTFSNTNDTITATIDDHVSSYTINGTWSIDHGKLKLVQSSNNKVYYVDFNQDITLHAPVVLTIIDSNGTKVVKNLQIQNVY